MSCRIYHPFHQAGARAEGNNEAREVAIQSHQACRSMEVRTLGSAVVVPVGTARIGPTLKGA
jgi:hypothetical protein